ncbi:MAG: hypothetical protein IT290_12625 [Deltaproteobacteria bacterium]|nr:hypothetical protein [Deltaproteobacteria bacterium]
MKSLGADYARVGWMLEDAIEMLHDEELDGQVDYTAEFDVLTREFIPSIRAGLSGNGEIVERPKGKTSKRTRRTTKR